MRLETCNETALEELAAMRPLLWPEEDSDHRADALRALNNPDAVTILARVDAGEPIGFAEATLRRDYVNGCATSPVGFLEAIYVREPWRRQGVARALVGAVEAWTRARGCSELASDAFLNNRQSHALHQALGFSETERVVYFRKVLGT